MITLRSIKHHPDMSEETMSFSATIYSGTRRIGSVRNEGMGGCNRYEWTDRETALVALQGVGLGFHHEGLDEFFGDIILREDIRKKLTRKCAKNTLFRLKGDAPNEWRTVKSGRKAKAAAYNPNVRQWLLTTYSDQIETIANEGMDRAVEIEFQWLKEELK